MSVGFHWATIGPSPISHLPRHLLNLPENAAPTVPFLQTDLPANVYFVCDKETENNCCHGENDDFLASAIKTEVPLNCICTADAKFWENFSTVCVVCMEVLRKPENTITETNFASLIQ